MSPHMSLDISVGYIAPPGIAEIPLAPEAAHTVDDGLAQKIMPQTLIMNDLFRRSEAAAEADEKRKASNKTYAQPPERTDADIMRKRASDEENAFAFHLRLEAEKAGITIDETSVFGGHVPN